MRRVPVILLVAAVLLARRGPVLAADDPCEEQSWEGAAWTTRSGCLPVPLDWNAPEGESISLYFELSAPVEPALGNLLVFHGGPAFPSRHLPSWAPLWKGLRGHFTILYFHQRGSGYSGRITDPAQLLCKEGLYTFDAIVLDAHRLAAELLPGPAVLFGKSAGGFLALKYALRYPGETAALVLAATGAQHRYISRREEVKMRFMDELEERHKGWKETYLAAARAARLGTLLPGLSRQVRTAMLDSILFDLQYTLLGQFEMVAIARGAAAGRDDLLLQRMQAGQQTLKSNDLESIPLFTHMACRELLFGLDSPSLCPAGTGTAPYDIVADLAEIRAPALVLSGLYDPVLPTRFQQEIVGHLGGPVTWVVLDLYSHMVFEEQPWACTEAILDFLSVPRQQIPQSPVL